MYNEPVQLTIDWLTLFSFLLNLLLAGIGLYQFISSKKEEENTKSKVKLWQKSAEGLKNGLINIAVSPDAFSNKNDIAKAVQSLSQIATSLDDSFVEERFYTEKEVKAKRESTIREQKKLFSFSASPSASKPISKP